MKGGVIQGYHRLSSKRGGEGIHTCDHEVTGDPSLRGVSRQALLTGSESGRKGVHRIQPEYANLGPGHFRGRRRPGGVRPADRGGRGAWGAGGDDGGALFVRTTGPVSKEGLERRSPRITTE